jgi:succinate-acetate transporter protein
VGFFDVTGAERGIFTLGFAVIALAFAPAGAVHNTVLPITLLCVSAGLGFHALGAFTTNRELSTLGAWILLIAAALAAYMLVEKFYWLTLGRRVVPLGLPWLTGSPDRES